MRIESVRIKNFRSFKDETIHFDEYTCFVGANGVGKSTVLQALNVFFRENDGSSTNLLSLSDEDFHKKNIDAPVEITVTFTDLSASAKRDLEDYVRHDKLIVTSEAYFDPDRQRADVEQKGERLGIKEFSRFFGALKAKEKVAELREIYESIRKEFAELPVAKSQAEMTTALRAFEDAHPDAVEPLRSGDQFYGFTKGKNRLDAHVQWVFVPAVKDASTEAEEAKNTALGKLLARTVRSRVAFADEVEALRQKVRREYDSLLAGKQDVLDQISKSLSDRIGEWSRLCLKSRFS